MNWRRYYHKQLQQFRHVATAMFWKRFSKPCVGLCDWNRNGHCNGSMMRRSKNQGESLGKPDLACSVLLVIGRWQKPAHPNLLPSTS